MNFFGSVSALAEVEEPRFVRGFLADEHESELAFGRIRMIPGKVIGKVSRPIDRTAKFQNARGSAGAEDLCLERIGVPTYCLRHPTGMTNPLGMRPPHAETVTESALTRVESVSLWKFNFEQFSRQINGMRIVT